MMSYTENTRGREGKPYAEMTGPELVVAFNTLAATKTGVELGAKQVQRFSDRQSAIKRIEALSSSIKARENGLKGVDDDEPKQTREVMLTDLKQKGGAELNTRQQVLDSFQARAGTNREKLLQCLVDHLGKQVAVGDLIKATYGNKNEENKGALMMVMKGAFEMIKKHKLPLELVKEKKDGEVTYGLHKK